MSQGEMGEFGEPKLIHGCLQATIFEAKHIHHSFQGKLLQGLEKVEKALQLNFLSHSKLYATVDIGLARIARSRQVEFSPQNPVWSETFKLYCSHVSSSVTFSVKNQLAIDAELIGRATIPADQILTGEPIEGWFDLFDDAGNKLDKAQIHVRVQFIDAKSEPNWNAGIKSPDFPGLSNSFFPQRTGCSVTLYQNSHLSNDFSPKIQLSNGEFYQPQRLWEDLYKGITEAKHFIYVAGWSVNTSITLVRDPERMIPGAEDVTIGELLKRKAEEGVTVLVMVWQDQTSISFLGNAGVMKTSDEKTLKFFEKTKVKCFLCPRNPDSSLTAVQKVEVGLQFTHHQKTVSLDAPISENSSQRQIVSYVGGIDLSDGRYDNEKHSLFRTLDTIYRNDFLQGNFPGADLLHGGPREPWHDVHSKLEGPGSWDVLTNFEQRWIKQSPKSLSKALFPIRETLETFPPPSPSPSPESWNVQIFRSIDGASVVGFPTDPEEADRCGLMSAKDVVIDQSIHVAYIEAIRRASRFIYIENQYFLGSCYAWKEDEDCGCLNQVPMEIALKVASKIRAGERFAVYVMTPMWPEGEPEGTTVQTILHWNRLTMEMMYLIIAQAIEEVGLGGTAHPTDYLNFFCIGNREAAPAEGEYVPPETPPEGSDYWKAQKNRRFLVYVHSKLMIVDDEYVIMGSANLNQRSLEGGRDTEIAHGSYQPNHLNGSQGRAEGLVYGFRMSLWYEHFMSQHSHQMEVFTQPESLQCVRAIREITNSLWAQYVGEEIVDLPGHLLPFPIIVGTDGSLSEMTKDGAFPDTCASIEGKKCDLLPPILTT